MKILGIETSCDETAASVIEANPSTSSGQDNVKILSNVISSQIDIHKKYGGIVPEVAAREHVLDIIPVINASLKKAHLTPKTPLLIRRGKGAKATGRGIGLDAIAVTVGPGLVTSLQVGVETAKTLSYAWNVPIIGVNHIEGHVYANFIKQTPKLFPSIILTVSGGHTKLILMKDHGKYETIGETRDDAAGEAFDKAAKLMGLSYPGGPIISEYAKKFNPSLRAKRSNPETSTLITGSPRRHSVPPRDDVVLPRPMIHSKSFDFSFSGLKTAILYQIQEDKNWKKKIPEYCHEFQQAIIDVLIHKTLKAAKKYNAKSIMLTGGVSANTELRTQIKKAVKKQLLDARLYIPDLKYTTDNAAVIAVAGYYKAKRKEYTHWEEVMVDCNLEL